MINLIRRLSNRKTINEKLARVQLILQVKIYGNCIFSVFGTSSENAREPFRLVEISGQIDLDVS